MNLLQPWMLWALPLVALPIVIHLIHRRRQRVIEWGAMRFLLARTRLSRGLQKLRHFLILACRVLAVGALVFAIGRPMTGGWLGSVAGVGADTVIVILDRSASMATQVQGRSRLTVGVERLVHALEVVHAKKWLALDGATGEFVRVESPPDLLRLPAAHATGVHSDMPALFETALRQIKDDRGGRAEIWVCSDLQATDWDVSSGRWANVKKELAAMQGTVGVHLLALTEPTPANLRVSVLGVELRKTKDGQGADLALDVEVRRDEPTDTPIQVPLTVAFGSGRSVVELTLRGGEARSDGLVVPLPREQASGVGKVELPADDNPMDNVAFVTYGSEPARRTVVVAEDDAVAHVLSLAAEAPMRDGLEYVCTSLALDRAAELDLAQASLLLWQGPLPPAALRERIDAFVERGGRVVFLPSRRASAEAYRGVAWGEWQEMASDQADHPSTWREDADLLANAGDARALPLGRTEVYASCRIVGQGTALARLQSQGTLLLRAPTDRGGVYFLATLPRSDSSNLARQGILLVALVHRALEDGVRALRPGASLDAGANLGRLADWQPLLRFDDGVLSLEQNLFPGVLHQGDRTVAIRRPLSEDAPAALAPAAISDLLAGVGVTISVNDSRDDGALVEEIWKLLLLGMALALVGEALLSLLDMGGRVAH